MLDGVYVMISYILIGDKRESAIRSYRLIGFARRRYDEHGEANKRKLSFVVDFSDWYDVGKEMRIFIGVK